MSGIDRLAELQREGNVSTSPEEVELTNNDSASADADIAEHMKKYEPIKKGLDVIKTNCATVDKLRATNKTVATEKARKDVMAQMDEIMQSTNKFGHAIKKALDDIKADNAQYSAEHSDSAKNQMRQNLYQTHIRRFQQVMNEYNASAHSFKQDLQKRMRREIKIVDSTLNDEQVESIVESGKAGDVIKQALVSDNLQDAVRVIEERHLDILRLEQQVLEIYELFRDLATLVDLQQESLDVIENRISHARNYTERAEVDLQAAEDYQKKARSRQCCILIIILVIIVVVLAPTLAKVIPEKS